MGMPKYQVIENDLKNQILNGKFEYGDRFYSESELQEKYEVSSITVIRAIKDLVKEGLLVRYQGKGTFVSRSRKRRLVQFSDVEVFTGSYDHDNVSVVEIQKGNEPKILKEMNLKKTDHYYRFTRLRTVSNIPFMVHYSYIPQEFVNEKLKSKDDFKSLYRRFIDDYGIHLFDEPFEEIDELVTPPNAEISRLLNIGFSEPVVQQTKKTYLSEQDNKIGEYVIAYKKWDFFKIKFSTINI